MPTFSPYIYNSKKKKAARRAADPPIPKAKPTKITDTKSELSDNEKAKIILARAIKEATGEGYTIVYQYPILPEYYGKLIYNHLRDFADSILKENPYNSSITPPDYENLSAFDKLDYMLHLKSYFNVPQYELNTEWVPNGAAWFPKGMKCSAKVDIAVIYNNEIKELWFITPTATTINERAKAVIAAGYKDIPIYYLDPSWVTVNRQLPASMLYKTAIDNAKNLQLTAFIEPVAAPTEENIQFDAKLILAKSIKEKGLIPYIDYPIFNNYGIMPLNSVIDDFASKILKFKPYNNSTTPLDINQLSEDDFNKYIAHLKSYGGSEQYELSDHWIPNKFIQRMYNNKLISIMDIAINDGDVICELWEIVSNNNSSNKKIDEIKACGFEHIRIYQISTQLIMDHRGEPDIYELAKSKAKVLN